MYDRASPHVIIDRTHLQRRASGLERVTRELFSDEALAPLHVEGMQSPGGRLPMMARQMVWNPFAALMRPEAVWVFPGYPPSPAFALMRERAVLYVHDLFLLTRVQDLNVAAKLYMARPFRLAVRRLRYFLVNSRSTGRALADWVGEDAQIRTYRPPASNVFGLRTRLDGANSDGKPLVVGAVGTVEPRKNFPAAAAICEQLAAELRRSVELHIVGRQGWGKDFEDLSRKPHVRMHGFLSDEAARAVIESFDIFLCTSRDEGLGLPLLEAQFAGIPVIAPDQEVFREVLAASGTYIDPQRPREAAATIADLLQRPHWRKRHADLAAANLARWNALADGDRQDVIAFLSELSRRRHGEARQILESR